MPDFNTFRVLLLPLQVNENLEKEKKIRADVEKVKRKLENDLKITQESVEELDRLKRELEDNLKR